MTRFFQSLAIFVGVWVLGSFLGVMLDPGHKNLWTQSLMWALLSSVILAPVFIFVGTSESTSSPHSKRDMDPFDEPGETSDRVRSHEEDGWPYTSEHGEAGSSDPGPVTRGN